MKMPLEYPFVYDGVYRKKIDCPYPKCTKLVVLNFIGKYGWINFQFKEKNK